MKSLKNHLSIILPLLALLGSYQFYSIVSSLVKSYEQRLSEEYSIVVVSVSDIFEDDIKNRVKEFKSLEEITPDSVLSKFENQFSSSNYALLKVSLPKFYRVNLEIFPSNEDLNKISESLYDIPSVKRVETFIKSHNQIYKLLLLLNQVAEFFGVAIFIVAILLIVKQVEVWKFEHLQRMRIMALFGAPLWMRSAVLFRLAIIDSIISAILVWIGLYYFLESELFKNFLLDIDIKSLRVDLVDSFITLISIGIILSLLSVFLTILKEDRE